MTVCYNGMISSMLQWKTVQFDTNSKINYNTIGSTTLQYDMLQSDMLQYNPLKYDMLQSHI